MSGKGCRKNGGDMLELLKDAGRALWPEGYARFSIRRHNKLMLSISKRLLAAGDGKVMTGPFSGMAYIEEACGSALCPKLVGSYEAELHQVIQAIIQRPYPLIVDVGAAEGYYACGLAMRLPHARVLAYDINPVARELCERMARLNGVEHRVKVMAACTPAELNGVLLPGSLVLCDCEGYEMDLLDPAAVPALGACDLLVELHEHLVPGVLAEVARRFKASHDIQSIMSCARDGRDYQFLGFLDSRQRQLAVHEYRPATQQWLWMRCAGGTGKQAGN